MSDPIQMPSAAALAQVAAVRSEPVVAPTEQAQTESRDSREHRGGEERSQSAAAAAGGRKLSITRDENIKAFVYRSIDEESGEVVWQWPAEDKLRRAQRMRAIEEQRQAEEHAVDHKA